MKIAVDFDGTIVEHRYPEIGEEKLFAFETLKQLQKLGHQLILWTFRNGKELDEAVSYCKKHGVEFYAVNKSYPEEEFLESKISRKIDADVLLKPIKTSNNKIGTVYITPVFLTNEIAFKPILPSVNKYIHPAPETKLKAKNRKPPLIPVTLNSETNDFVIPLESSGYP